MGENSLKGDVEFIISLAKYFNTKQIVLVQKENGKNFFVVLWAKVNE